MSPQFRVTLTKEEVEELQKISSTGSRSAKIVLFARALLLLIKALTPQSIGRSIKLQKLSACPNVL